MKKLILLVVLAISFSACQTQQNVNNFYTKYQGTENSMSFKAPLFLASLMVEDQQEFQAFKKKIKSVRVLSLSELDENEYTIVNNEIKSALTKDNFENWFDINKDGLNINVSAQNRGKSVRNVVIALQGSDKLIFVNAKTKLSEDELTDFITSIMSSDKK